MELKDLVGLHMLDAVDFETVLHEDSQTCRFRIDGVVWAAIEDPEDGYRSSMRELVRVGDAEMKNTFPAVQVMGVYRGIGADILTFVNTSAGLQVLEIGTENTDDYYPSFVADFQPQNMPVNADPTP